MTKNSKKVKPRIILFSGKGGVGKTTAASATGIACAKRGKKTIILSIDIAHSLADSFSLPQSLFDTNAGNPVSICENLDMQEIDLQLEIERHWGDLTNSIGSLMTNGGMNEVLAEELAIIPGMADIVCLLYIQRYLEKGEYDVIILDSAPTGESLRFISMPTTVDWYVQKIYQVGKTALKFVNPLKKMAGDALKKMNLATIKETYKNLESIREILLDSSTTSVRLVCTPERMVINETLRAYMYFCLYGMSVDMVLVNRILPKEADNGYFTGLIKGQEEYIKSIESSFLPAKVMKNRLFPREVLGLDSLTAFGDELFGDIDPSAVLCEDNPYNISKKPWGYMLQIKLPGVDKDFINLHKEQGELIVRIGSFKRHVYLPKHLESLDSLSAKYEDGYLNIELRK